MLPPDFIFSQQNLQDYHDCPRRFHLRYVEHLAWPAIESEPVLEQEKRIQLGHDFHVLVQQNLMGIPSEVLRESIQDEELLRWWLHFEALELNLTSQKSFVEEVLSVPLAGYRLLAKLDLILVDGDSRIHIFDWKTSHSEPSRAQLLERAQSIVYPYVVTRCSRELTGTASVNPGDIEMTYWFPEYPALPVSFNYSDGKYAADENRLISQMQEITSREGRQQFSKTEEERKCKFCKYRTLCERNPSVGHNDEEPSAALEDELFNIDFESL